MLKIYTEEAPPVADTFWSSLREQLQKAGRIAFEADWPGWVAGIFLAVLALLIFLWDSPWGIAAGYRNWGDWILYFLGSGASRPEAPWLHHVSITNIGLFWGALASALLSRKFQIRRAPALEYGKALAGGICMGAGAALSKGCNVGGFYTAVGVFSLGGYAMMIGLGTGAFLGLKYLIWEMEKLPPKPAPAADTTSQRLSRFKAEKAQPYLGGALLAGGVLLFYLYAALGRTQVGGLMFFGLLIGVVMHRSRFCFVRAFRCPYMTGDSEMVKVVALSLILYGAGSAVIKWSYLQPDTMGVHHPFWIGSLAGGLVFGFGMLLAGGCASSTLWRIGEGHTKLLATLAGFSLTNALAGRAITASGIDRLLGQGVFAPQALTWHLFLPLALVFLVGWVILAAWNEKTEKFVIF